MQHEFKWLVGYADTDAAQIIYHPNYLAIADRARTSWFYDNAVEFANNSYLLVVYATQINFKAPAKLGDKLCIISQIEQIGAAKISLKQCFYRAKELLCEINIDLVCVDAAQLKPIKLPKNLRSKLDKLKN